MSLVNLHTLRRSLQRRPGALAARGRSEQQNHDYSCRRDGQRKGVAVFCDHFSLVAEICGKDKRAFLGEPQVDFLGGGLRVVGIVDAVENQRVKVNVGVECAAIDLALGAPGTSIAYTPAASAFDLVTGDLSDLLADGEFSDVSCLGTALVSPAIDPSPEPDPGDGRDYLARGVTSCVRAGYGNSSLIPDPRDALDAEPCP